jgi:hypothetical protein
MEDRPLLIKQAVFNSKEQTMNLINRLKKIWSQKWGRRVAIAAVIALLLSIPMRCGGPYKGRVIDRITRQPIMGAIAVASWSDTTFNVAGGTTRHLCAKEAVTDENGEFVIKGSRGPFFGLFTGAMVITLYRVGYKPVACDWNYIENPGSCFEKGGSFEGDIAIFPLVRVANDRLRYEGYPPFGGGEERRWASARLYRRSKKMGKGNRPERLIKSVCEYR